MEQPTAWELTKWRRRIMLLDAVWDETTQKRISECVMCRGRFRTFALQAHHIYPKSLYPDLALADWNGIMLCVGCHMGTVHAGNSRIDLGELNNWERFAPMFLHYTKVIRPTNHNMVLMGMLDKRCPRLGS